MTGPWTIRESGMLAGAVLLSLSIAYLFGKHEGQLSERLSSNQTQIHASDSVSKSVAARSDSATKSDSILTLYRSHVREKVIVKRDSIFVRDTVYVSSDIAQLIAADDSTIHALERSLALRDTLIANLRSGISLRDTRIKLLESENTPGKVKRIINATRWLAIGAVVGVAIAHR